MKKSLLALAVAAAFGLTACGTTQKLTEVEQPKEATTPIKETTISTEFTDEGVKLSYTLTGKLEKIEVIGQAPAWKGNYRVLAEADAMEKLVKFVYGKDVDSNNRISIIGRSLEHAQDDTLNRFRTGDDTLAYRAEQFERPLPPQGQEQEQASVTAVSPAVGGPGHDSDTKQNTLQRRARVIDQTLVRTVTNITSRGRLIGVRKTGDEVVDNGRTYVAYYQWSEKELGTARYVRGLMAR